MSITSKIKTKAVGCFDVTNIIIKVKCVVSLCEHELVSGKQYASNRYLLVM